MLASSTTVLKLLASIKLKGDVSWQNFSCWSVQQDTVLELLHSLHVLRKELLEEDRQRRLEEMEQDTAEHQELRFSRVSAATQHEESAAGQNSNGDRGGGQQHRKKNS